MSLKLKEKLATEVSDDTIIVTDLRSWEDYPDTHVRVFSIGRNDKLVGAEDDYRLVKKYLTTDYCNQRIRVRTVLHITAIAMVVLAFTFLVSALVQADTLYSAACVVVSVIGYAILRGFSTDHSNLSVRFPQEHVFEKRIDRALMCRDFEIVPCPDELEKVSIYG